MLSSVLTTCAIFLPLIFMSGIAGALFYDEAMAVTITLVSALIVSVLVIPVFYYLFYRNQPCFTPNRFIQKISVGGMTSGYERIMSWFFRHRGVMWSIFGVSVLLIGLLFINLDKQKLPALSHSDTLVNIEWNERVSVEENNSRCEKIVAQFPDLVEQYTSMTGAQQFALSHTRETGISEAIIYLKAGSVDDIKEIESRVADFIHSNWREAVCTTQASGNIFDMLFSEKEAPVVARLKCSNGKMPEPDQLTTLLFDIRDALPGITVQPAEWNEYIELVTDRKNWLFTT